MTRTAKAEQLAAYDRARALFNPGDAIVFENGDYFVPACSFKERNRIKWEGGAVIGNSARDTVVAHADLVKAIKNGSAKVVKQ